MPAHVISGKPSLSKGAYGFYGWLCFFLFSLLGGLVYLSFRDADILEPPPIRRLMLVALGCAGVSIALYHRYGFKEHEDRSLFLAGFVGMTSFLGYLVFGMVVFVVLNVELSSPTPETKEFVVTRVERAVADFTCTDKTLPGVYQKWFGQDKLGERSLSPGDRILIPLFRSRMGYWWYREKEVRFEFAGQ